MFVKKLLSLVFISATSFAAPLVEEFKTRQSNCADVTVLFAHGSLEPGSIGLLVGPLLQFHLQNDLQPKSLTFTGIEYPVDLLNNNGPGLAKGVQNMVNRVKSTASFCPDTKIAVSGYSQGARIVHLALAQLSPEDQKRVLAVVTFGDPYRNQVLPGVLQSRLDSYCDEGDTICDGSGDLNINPPHLLYGLTDTPAGAAFIVTKVS